MLRPHTVRGRALIWSFATIVTGAVALWAWWPAGHLVALGSIRWGFAVLLAISLVGRWLQRCPRCRDSAYHGPGSMLALWPAHTCRMCGYDYRQDQR